MSHFIKHYIYRFLSGNFFAQRQGSSDRDKSFFAGWRRSKNCICHEVRCIRLLGDCTYQLEMVIRKRVTRKKPSFQSRGVPNQSNN